jgi:hypothetical protein
MVIASQPRYVFFLSYGGAVHAHAKPSFDSIHMAGSVDKTTIGTLFELW